MGSSVEGDLHAHCSISIDASYGWSNLIAGISVQSNGCQISRAGAMQGGGSGDVGAFTGFGAWAEDNSGDLSHQCSYHYTHGWYATQNIWNDWVYYPDVHGQDALITSDCS
jgi:hypothetical protein